MKKILLIANLITMISQSSVAQQCLGGGCTSFTNQYPSGTFSTTSPTWQLVNGANNMNAGNYTKFSVTPGNTYEWSYCEDYGGTSTAWDAQLTLFNDNNTTTPICFSTDDCGTTGNAPYISWTATAGVTTVRVLTTAYSGSGCLTNSSSPYNKLVWRQSASAATCTGAPSFQLMSAISYSPNPLTAGAYGTYTATVKNTGSSSGAFDFELDLYDASGYVFPLGKRCGYTISPNSNQSLTFNSSSTDANTLPTCLNPPYTIKLNAICNSCFACGNLGCSVGVVSAGSYSNPASITVGGSSCCTTPGTPATATGTATGQTTANLSWTAGSPAGSPTVTYYWVVGTSSSVTYNNGIAQGNTASTSATATGLSAGTTYYLRVYAYTNCDASSSSYKTSSSFTTNSVTCTTPGTPATATGTATGQTTANLSWTAGSPVGSATVTYYWVVGTSSSVTYNNGIAQGNTASTSATATGLSAGTTYYLRVYAYTNCDASSSSYKTSSSFTTNSVTCTTPGTPATATGTATGQTTANLSWTAGSPAGSPTVTYYWVVGTSSSVTYNNGIAQGNTASTSATATGLSAGTTYYLRVYAYTNCDASSSSYKTSSSFTTNSVTCTTPGTPATATGTATGQTTANLSWTAGSPVGSATVTYYWVVGTSSSVTYNNGIAQGNTASTSATATGLSAGTTYYLRVYAYTNCDASSSSYKTSSSFTTNSVTCTTPGTPATATGTATGQTTANLSWTAGSPVGSATVTYYWVVGTSSSVTYGNGIDQGTTASTSAITSALSTATTYYLRVYAKTSCDNSFSGYKTSSTFTTTSGSGVNTVPATISSPLPSVSLYSGIFQSSLPNDLYTAPIPMTTCIAPKKCQDAFQSPSFPNNTTAGELLPKACNCFSSLNYKWEFRQRGYVTNNGGNNPCNVISQCQTTTQSGLPAVTHSQNACWDKDDRCAWDTKLQGSINSNGICVYAIEAGTVVYKGSSALYIKHPAGCTTGCWYSWYDNITPTPGLTSVSKNQHIGHIKALSPLAKSHLHFSVLYKDGNNQFVSSNPEILPDYTHDITGQDYTISNLQGTCTGSIVSGAKISFTKEGEWFSGGLTDENGRFDVVTIPGLANNDTLRIEAGGYETLDIKLDSSNYHGQNVKIPLLKKNVAVGVVNPRVVINNNLPYFPNPSVQLSITGQNFNSYDIYRAYFTEETIEYVPISLNNSNSITIASISLSDTGSNNIAVLFKGVDSVIIFKEFQFLPSANNYNVQINADSSSLFSKIYLDGQYLKELSQLSEIISLQDQSHTFQFSKLGYSDTILNIDNSASISISLSQLPSATYLVVDSSIIDFPLQGKVQYRKNVTVMDSAQQTIISVRQYQDNFSGVGLIPKSRKFEFRHLNTNWSGIRFAGVLDQTDNFSDNSVYLLRVYDDQLFTKIPFDTNGIIAGYDSAVQKLDYKFVNFDNGNASKEALVIAEKQAPTIQPLNSINVAMNDSVILNTSMFFSDPDSIQNDMTVQLLSSTPQLNASLQGNSIVVKPVQGWTGSGTLILSAQHDFLTRIDSVRVIVQNCFVSLPAMNVNVADTSGTDSIVVNAGSSCQWSITGGCSWVTLDSLSGSGTSTLSFSYQQNPLPSQRTCFINIQGNIFTITQAPSQTCVSPVTNFTTPQQAGFTPFSVSFADASTNSPTQWQWSFSGGSPSSSTSQNPIVTYSNAGLFDVSLTASNACGSSTYTRTNYINVIGTMGIGNILEDDGISIYPNPNKGTFKVIVNTQQNQAIHLKLFSATGYLILEEKLLSSMNKVEKEISLPNVSAGVYLLQIVSDKKPSYKKLVVE
jgi:hypothetical protein